MSKRQKPKITFGVDDLRTPEQLERVLRQFESAMPGRAAPVTPDLDKLASILGPQIRDMLQGTGSFPINLQSLLPGVSTGQFLEDTHANRLASFPPGNYAVGTVFYETDRTVYYIVNVAKVWECIPGGYMKGTLDPDEKPTDLTGGEDYRFEFWSTDFSKYFIWTGTDWERRGDQLQKGFIQMCSIGPAIGIPGWQLCDGSNVNSSRDDGTTEFITVPDYGAAPYVKLATSTFVGPAAGSGTVASEALHTHNVAVGATTTGVNSIDAVVRSDTPPGLTVANTGHTHDVDYGTITSAAGSSHTHGPGTLELANTQLRAYYRL